MRWLLSLDDPEEVQKFTPESNSSIAPSHLQNMTGNNFHNPVIEFKLILQNVSYEIL